MTMPFLTPHQKELLNIQNFILEETILKNPYIPITELRPSAKQFEFLAYDDREELFGGAVGGGKATYIETPILTIHGWKTMGTVTTSDHVFGMNGEPIRVLAVSEVMHDRPCYKMVFDDGTRIIADADHRWLVCTADDIDVNSHGLLRTTKEIAESVPPLAIRHSSSFRDHSRYAYDSILRCDPVDSVPVRCIQVDVTDGMFLIGPTMIPTHNSDALLMAALQYVSVPGYSVLMFRRTYKHLMMDGGLIPRSKEWISRVTGPQKAEWREKSMQWTFPSGATMTFGYFDHDDHKQVYMGGNWQTICWDELTQFKESWYLFLFSRLRKPDWVCKHCKLPLMRQLGKPFVHKQQGECVNAEPIDQPVNEFGLGLPDVPLRIRSASNPGGPGHEFCKRRFVVPGAPKKFVPSYLKDNPGLDKEEYRKSLSNLDEITRKQLEEGDWNAYEGGRFKKHWFREFWVEEDRNGHPVYKWSAADVDGKIHPNWPTCPWHGIPVSVCWNFITCDPAASVETGSISGDPSGEKGDYTAIGVFAVTPTGEILVLHVERKRIAVEEIVPEIERLCYDFSPMFVGIEDVAFQRAIIREGQRTLGVAVERLPTEGKSKLVRATPIIIRSSEGQVFIPKDEPKGRFPWLEDFLAELIQWTGDEKLDSYDDQVDVFAYSALSLARHGLASPVLIQPECDEEENDRGLGIFMSN